MKSKMSYFNLGIQKQNIKQHGWISLVYFIALLFALPLRMVLLAEDEYRGSDLTIENLFASPFAPQTLIVIGISIVTGIVLFRYLQVPVSADMMHSFPIKRGQLLWNQITSGTVMLLIPVWLTGIVVFLIESAYPFFELISAGDVWIWIAIVSTMSLFFFLFTVFIGMMTGISLASGILTVIVLMLPVGLISLINVNLSMYVYGFPSSYAGGAPIANWSPIVMLSQLSHQEIDPWQIVIYFVLAILSGLAAWMLYRFRHIETATQAITFKPLRPVFKYGVTFCAMLVGGLYFDQYESMNWVIFGYIFGSLIGYLVAEIILQKTWRVFQVKTLFGYAGYGIVILLVGIVIRFDVIGFESNVPSVEDVDSVYFGHNIYQIREAQMHDQSYSKNENYIENVRAFHKEITTEKPKEISVGHRRLYNSNYVFGYKLENGSMVVREYRNISMDGMEEMSAVMESKSYKNQEYNLEDLDQDITSVHFLSHHPVHNGRLTINDTEEIKELQEIIKYEISTMEVEDMRNRGMEWGTLQVGTEDGEHEKTFEVPWNKSFEELDIWLKNNGYLDQARITTENVNSIEVIRLSGGAYSGMRSPHQVFTERKDQGNEVMEVEDEAVMEETLKRYSESGTGEYIIRIVLEGDQEAYGVVPKDRVPDEIRSSFE
ncbi:ABC-2 type transport system permease protein [Salibacterium salarium]|uniref:DUF6449 domain-containing protein n=1 Tax=Salibacterium salarium TaxID=284579 RepID=UPI002781E34C|nr:DUF6449 domain-containing protein [Salibacterium salarium]MDQ0300714.1 ABC-2 type transport system permease protein [Salibacterium salarium]